MSNVCSEFYRTLKMVDTDTYKVITTNLYALVMIHAIKSGNSPDLFPYDLKHTETAPDEHFITFSLEKLPIALRRILLKYMTECLSHCSGI